MVEGEVAKEMYAKAHSVICQALADMEIAVDDVPNKFLARLEQAITGALVDAYKAGVEACPPTTGAP